MKILLIHLSNQYFDKERGVCFFPIGVGYIAGALLRNHHDVDVLDLNTLDLSDAEVINIIKAKRFDIVGISAMSTQYKYVKWLSAEIKKIHKDKKIILGWVLATYSSHIVLRDTDVDFCVIGEGEITINELLDNLDNPQAVQGISYKQNGRIITAPQREYIENIDTIPMIPYNIFPMDKYINSLSTISLCKNQRTANISCGRGCPYSCHFCSKSFSGVRFRTIDKVIEEIKFLQVAYGIERIFFTDELLVVNKKRIYELCEKILPLNLEWSCQARINHVNEEILLKMKAAGCTAVGYGVESGSQKILDAMNKGIDVNKSVEVIRLTKKLGLYPIIQVIFGYPGEDIHTINETIEYFKKIDEPAAQFSPITPLPGTKLWEECLEKNIIIDEAVFLEKLEGGYMPDAPTLMNFTSFSDEELDRLRKGAERKIRLNYLKMHPIRGLNNLKSKITEKGLLWVCNRILQELHY